MKVRISARHATDEDLVADLARVAAADAGPSTLLTRDRYDREGRFHSSTVVRRLGSWAAACERAGLDTGRPDLGHSDDVWMRNVYDVWLTLGRQPSYGDIRNPPSTFSPEGYAKRYGSWTKALLAFQNWVDSKDDPETSPLPDSLSGQGAQDCGKTRSRTPSLRLRWQVLERDRFTCRSCGTSPATAPGTVLHVDHITPFSKDGETEIDNLQTLCDRCNYGKADGSPAI